MFQGHGIATGFGMDAEGGRVAVDHAEHQVEVLDEDFAHVVFFEPAVKDAVEKGAPLIGMDGADADLFAIVLEDGQDGSLDIFSLEDLIVLDDGDELEVG